MDYTFDLIRIKVLSNLSDLIEVLHAINTTYSVIDKTKIKPPM